MVPWMVVGIGRDRNYRTVLYSMNNLIFIFGAIKWLIGYHYTNIYNLIQTSFLALRLFYGGYGCLEKNGGKENNLRQMRHPQIEDVLGQLSLSDSFFSHRFFFDVIWMLTVLIFLISVKNRIMSLPQKFQTRKTK